MSAAARKPAEKLIPAIDIFRERCEARAILVNALLFDLQDAVDGLQEAAEKTGLVKDIGQDAVQKMMAEAFAIVPRSSPLSNKDEPSLTDNVSKSHADTSLSHKEVGAATSILRTAEYLVQLNDLAKLKTWLALHTAAERLAIRRHFERRK